MTRKETLSLESDIHAFLTDSFSPKFDEIRPTAPSNKVWQKLNALGTELWLDTGNIEEIGKYWTQQFNAVTTNNTLLNREIQTGIYDPLISMIAGIIDRYDLDRQQRLLEFAFVLNAYHGLRLVEKFDAYVSVEEHTALAHDVHLAVDYARRYHAICPQRFIVKIPFTPAGLLATRKISALGIPVNHTLGFSARQNYVIARIGRPEFVNVFLGRLNSFVIDNGLGDGQYVGEKATLASQKVIEKLRETHSTPSRQIAASLRDGQQVINLAGVDVMTMPAKVAEHFLNMSIPPKQIKKQTHQEYEPGITRKQDIDKFSLNSLWDIPERLIKCVDKLENEDLDSYTPDDLVSFFRENKCGDILVKWDDEQIKTSTEEGKIPKLENWKKELTAKTIGLDSLMNLAGLCSFTKDQIAMDSRVKSVLQNV
ncbi:MAG: transaldolase family protein [Planctomycetota bacterium]|jgi:transaldolase